MQSPENYTFSVKKKLTKALMLENMTLCVTYLGGPSPQAPVKTVGFASTVLAVHWLRGICSS